MFWNREEVLISFSMEKFNQVRGTLNANNIKYTYRILNHNQSGMFASNRAVMGSYGEKSEYSKQYYIYVHKDDYDKASYLINQIIY